MKFSQLVTNVAKVLAPLALVATVGWATPEPAGADRPDAVELDAHTASVGASLLTFEGNVKWAAVSPAWAPKRTAWIASVKAASTPNAVAAKVLELESSMGWGAVNDSWKTRRAGWVTEIGATKSDSQAAKLLLELEGNTKWSAVEDNWKSVRGAWVAGLQKI